MQALWFSCCARLRSCSAPIGVTWQQTAYEASSLNSSPVHAWTPLSPFFTGGKQCDARGWFIVPRRSRISDPMTRCWASLHVPPGEAVSSRPGPRSMCRVHAWSPGSPARYYSRQWSRRMFKRRAEREERRPRVAVRAESGASKEVGYPTLSLKEYVSTVDPVESIDQFTREASPEVVDAMRQTITNMLGTLPPAFFDVTISTRGDNMAQLIYSTLMTGYLFCNASLRLDLQQSLALPAHSTPLLPGSASTAVQVGEALEGGGGYAPGTQSNGVRGDVTRWHMEQGAERMPAQEYIALLEEEVRSLRRSLREQGLAQGTAGNKILDYLKRLDAEAMRSLTEGAGEEVVGAMECFVARLLGSGDEETLKATPSQSTAVELAQLLLWLMVVGFRLRSMELRMEMAASMDGAPRLPGTSAKGA